MCYFPIGCLKGIVTIGAFCSILISLGLLAVSLYANFSKKQIIDRASEGLINAGLICLYIGSIIFLLLGIAGLYGSLKKNKNKKKQNTCLLGLYSVGIFAFFLIFLAGGIFFFLGPQAIFGTDCRSGAKTTLIEDLYKFSNQVSTTYFCQAQCQCYVNPANTALVAALAVGGFKNVSTTDNTLPIKYQNCPNQDKTQETSMLMLAALQQLLDCGGWCPSDVKFKRFTNINDCATAQCLGNLQACHGKFEDFMTQKGSTLAIACIIACVVCFLNVITVCCICFHPSKAGNRSKNFYARMMD